ncbi:MAG: phospho-N-acetylmuramoyl-pentapeptide-transferase [Candidatus Eisenbacteria bacterium]|uniref:Phospho-N-acetylmuramoyl-pentapeptide-transferase n=1 Tax=Eiseniibacteriota bacterium TaxID=2212470 RepID=A0A938BPU5_UNCEI|nr:phospho-N-acetylmuramoyl-pentapeptide-transferase [Candidatus Eisenbacteria bacterium]
MLYYLLVPLSEHFHALNVFRYITFRSAYAAVTALLLCFLLGPWMIRRLRRMRVGQLVRRDGPQSHLAKEGTPTMGGLLILAAIVFPTLLWADVKNVQVQLVLATTLILGALGFLDDYLHVVRGRARGLLGRYKLLVQFAAGLAVGTVIVMSGLYGDLTARTAVPFLKDTFINLGLLYVPFVALVVTGASNAVNLSDGLDGLAVGMVLPAAMAFGGLAYVSGHARFSQYLNIPFLQGAGELTVFCAAFLGAGLGFLWFNAHPAQVFMGDTGSLSLGGALGMVAVLIKRELLLVIVGGLFVAEVLSVVAQVVAYKFWGRRVLRMAPLHHHFELGQMPETKVVIRFWIISILLALLTLSTIKLQ